MMTTTQFSEFGEPISTYTREQAIEDGVLVSGNEGDLDEVTRQHYKYPVAMTAAVFGIMEKAVNSKQHCNDYKGIWHDMLWMSRKASRLVHKDQYGETRMFTVIITGAGRKRNHTFKIVCGPGDNAEPVLTILMPDED